MVQQVASQRSELSASRSVPALRWPQARRYDASCASWRGNEAEREKRRKPQGEELSDEQVRDRRRRDGTEVEVVRDD